jgi:protein SCO1/2
MGALVPFAKNRYAALLTALGFVWMTGSSYGQSTLPQALRGVRFDQRLNEQVPLDLPFKDETGTTVTLGDYCRDKPVILVLAYFRCPMLCDQVLNGLVRALLDLPFDVGKEFKVVTVSFDPRETPEMATDKKRTLLERYGRSGAGAGWHFLTGSEASIRGLTDAVGFHYTYDPDHDQFAHAAGIVVLTPMGKISRYFHDIRYSPRDLRLGLVEASANVIGSVSDQVLLYCFHYDPLEGRYGPTVINLVRAGGVLTVLAVATLFVVLWRRERRGRQETTDTRQEIRDRKQASAELHY